jgi:A/G-specific adenine glycosylase
VTHPAAETRRRRAFRDAVLAWYDADGRALPFRGTRDPYAVLVSEVMAQQTQVSRVGERWRRFLGRWPTIGSLAAARPDEVVREWRGLGYNRRAVALWRMARVVVAEHGGALPADVAALERLPGIGPYTARAVAAIAFGLPVGAVDTNVRRVLGRAFARPSGLELGTVQDLADRMVPRDRPGDWTHALMDVGATFCRSRAPRCVDCPARRWCDFAGSGPPTGATLARQRRPTPFALSTRWLRGRIVERLAAEPGGDWVRLGGRIGDHSGTAVGDALRALDGEGIVELDPADPRMARLARS